MPKHVVGVLLALVTLAYPLIVYLSLGRLEPRWLALLLLGLALARLVVSRTAVTWGFAAGALLLAVFSWAGNAWMPLKLYPVVVSAVLLALFAASLAYPPSAIERFARLREPDLPPEAVAYTRRVTQVWCVFFVFNGTLALVFALWGSEALWSLYTGVISYLLMGLLLGGELLLRRRFKRLHHG